MRLIKLIVVVAVCVIASAMVAAVAMYGIELKVQGDSRRQRLQNIDDVVREHRILNAYKRLLNK